MTARVGVSESAFHEAFPTVEECYRAAYREALRRLSRAIAEATAPEYPWLERVRKAIVAMLGFFDDASSWARMLLCETPLDAALTFECRQGLHGALVGLLERDSDVTAYQARGRSARTAGSPDLLATLNGELVAGGVFSVIRANLLERDAGKLVELAPSLMAFIVAPYLGRVAAQAELEGRPSGGETSTTGAGLARGRAISRAGELPIRATHRTTLVLRAIAQAPYSSNREIGRASGLADEGQASKLLARLEQRGVIENVGVGAARGEPNAWLLTEEGQRVLELLGESFADRAPRRTSTRVRGAR